MKKYILLAVILLAGCNSFRCEFTHPDNMSPALLEYCKAEASSSDIILQSLFKICGVADVMSGSSIVI